MRESEENSEIRTEQSTLRNRA